jgi:hypothetical protein
MRCYASASGWCPGDSQLFIGGWPDGWEGDVQAVQWFSGFCAHVLEASAPAGGEFAFLKKKQIILILLLFFFQTY